MKEMESSMTEDQQKLEERAQRQIADLQSKLKAVKAEEEKVRGELDHFREQKEWLDKELDRVRDELMRKNKKIELLQQTLDEKSDGSGELDTMAQAALIQELERDRETYTELNENLLEERRELSDKLDELKAENEQLKQKVIEEKRKRRRKKSTSSDRSTIDRPRGSRGKSERARKGSRGIPESVLEGMEAEEGDEGREVVVELDEGGGEAAAEPAVSGSEISEDLSGSEDEMVARSSE